MKTMNLKQRGQIKTASINYFYSPQILMTLTSMIWWVDDTCRVILKQLTTSGKKCRLKTRHVWNQKSWNIWVFVLHDPWNELVIGIQYGTCVRGRGRSQRMKNGSKRERWCCDLKVCIRVSLYRKVETFLLA